MQRWVPTLAVLPSLALALAAVSSVVATTTPLAAPSAGAAPAAQAEPELPDGIALQILASQNVTVAWPGGNLVDILVERVPLDAGEAVDGRDPDESGGGARSLGSLAQGSGMHLLHVERGEVVVGTREGEATVHEGESAFVPQPTAAEFEEARQSGSRPSYDLRNDSPDCATVLRLSVHFSGPGRGAIPSAPSGPERGCGEYEQLFYTLARFPWPENPPTELVVRPLIARLSWDKPASIQGVSDSFTASGPLVLVVESGSFVFRVGEMSYDPDVAASLGSGGTVQVRAGVPLGGFGGAGTTLLALGVFPSDQPWLVLPPPPGSGNAPAAATEIPVGMVVVTTEDRVRLRAGPSTADAILAELPRGTELTVTGPAVRSPGDASGWYPVTDAEGRSGFVSAPFVALAPE